MANTVTFTNSTCVFNIDANGVAVGPAQALNQSPLLHARKIRWRTPGIATATVKMQTAPRVDPLTGQAPAAGSASWTDLLLNGVAQVPAVAAAGEFAPDYWIRANVTVAGGAAAQSLVLEGVQ